MKVIGPRGWEGCRAHCGHCQSILLVETDDVQFSKLDGMVWYVTCGYCGKEVSFGSPGFMSTEAIPRNIRDRAYFFVVGKHLPKEFR